MNVHEWVYISHKKYAKLKNKHSLLAVKSLSLACVCHVVILGTSCFNSTVFPLMSLTAVSASWLIESAGDEATTGVMLPYRWAIGTHSQNGHFREHCLGCRFQSQAPAAWEGWGGEGLDCLLGRCVAYLQAPWRPNAPEIESVVVGQRCAAKWQFHTKRELKALLFFPLAAESVPATGREIKKINIEKKEKKSSLTES